ncbi:hypothetical protein [Pseudodesulfovibrio sp. zrk46]|uniref:hypothetical protein n=1 Tax=Pseudodesulfovibrio sp. zrk46 TaxID=2725288 RepID=UPI001FFD6822|nr:hypothetical protein [Pseudodesulfovibrio sp. zrk46]
MVYVHRCLAVNLLRLERAQAALFAAMKRPVEQGQESLVAQDLDEARQARAEK